MKQKTRRRVFIRANTDKNINFGTFGIPKFFSSVSRLVRRKSELFLKIIFQFARTNGKTCYKFRNDDGYFSRADTFEFYAQFARIDRTSKKITKRVAGENKLSRFFVFIRQIKFFFWKFRTAFVDSAGRLCHSNSNTAPSATLNLIASAFVILTNCDCVDIY